MKGAGFCGAHRTGKTTLAREVAAMRGSVFVQTSVSAVFAEHGIDPSESMNPEQRMFIQHRILEASMQDWAKASHANLDWVTDRTPIDFLGYTMADINGNSEMDAAALMAYVKLCLEALEKYFFCIVLVQPGIQLVPAPGKAALNPAYIEHLNSLMKGLGSEAPHDFFVMPRSLVSLPCRLGYMETLLGRVSWEYSAKARDAELQRAS